MYFILNKNKLFSLITFLITATIVRSSPQTFHVQKYSSPDGNTAPPSVRLYQGMNPGMVLSVIASSTARAINYNVFDVHGSRLICLQPRMDINLIGMNTLIGGWGTDVQTPKLQIKSDEKYCLHIAHDSQGYRIFLNGEAVYFYKHRSQNNATEFGLEGTGKIFLMSYKLNEPKWALQETKNAVYIEEFGDAGINTPYEIQFQDRNQLSTIIITGIINVSATCAEFNLMNSDEEILFQFNPRFIDNVVARNSYIDGRWGKEETSGAMVLQRNQRFTLAIDVEAGYYKTYINGEDFVTYKYRKPAHNRDITKIYISPDIKLFKIIYHK